MASLRFAGFLAVLASFALSSSSIRGEDLKEKREDQKNVSPGYLPKSEEKNKTNSFPMKIIEPSYPSDENLFTSRPDLRPTEARRVLLNRLGESISLTFDYYKNIYPALHPDSLSLEFREGTFNRSMQRAVERGLERTARVLFTDPLEHRITGSSLFSGFEGKFIQALSGWDNYTLADPFDPVKEGLPGKREVIIGEGFDFGAHLGRRNPRLFVNFKHSDFVLSTRLTAGSITDSKTYTETSPELTIIGQVPIKEKLPLDFSLSTTYNSTGFGSRFPISSYIGTHFELGKGKVNVGAYPNSRSFFVSYNFNF